MRDATDLRDPDRARDAADVRDAEPPTPRDVVRAGLDLPRDDARVPVHHRDHTYALRGSEVQALATVGAFRVVASDDLRDRDGRPGDIRHGDLEHLRREGLVHGVAPLDRGPEDRTTLLVLSARGHALLEAYRDPDHAPRQTYYHGLTKPRELAHNAHLYRAYLEAAARLAAGGARMTRIVLEDELKRDYQRFLQAGNRGRPGSDGRPDRSSEERAAWARDHQLPVIDGHVHFPDVRIEYEHPDGRRDVEDVEVLTPHYRGAHAAAKAAAGFTPYRARPGRVGASLSQGRGGRASDPHLAEELLR